jgi:hypothetical protein
MLDLVPHQINADPQPCLEEGPGEGEVRRYTELETILLGLDLQQYIPLFNQHRIDLPEFLVLTEADLKVLLERDS